MVKKTSNRAIGLNNINTIIDQGYGGLEEL
jgi:hypothetical protein